MKDALFARRCRALELLLFDVDGVLTDGTVVLLPEGGEAKAFHIKDGLGIVLAHAAGLATGLLSGRDSKVVARRAAELGMSVVRQGVKDKAAALRELLTERGLEAEQVGYVGDDLNDLPVIAAVGLSAAPKDAAFEVRTEAFMVLEAEGGRGCAREFVEAVLRARGDWDRVVAGFGVRP